MEYLSLTLIVLMALLGGLYFILILLFTIGWFRLKSVNYPTPEYFTGICVPYRNEAENLPHLLNDLLNQSVPKQNFEIILVNDHSNDEGPKIINEFKNSYPELNIKALKNEGRGKKEAIVTAVKNSKAEIILCTDADCRIPHQWIKKMIAPFRDKNIELLSGPVAYKNEKKIFTKIQSLDFLSLVASAAGAIGIKLPFMCNGANLAFRKSSFEKLNVFEENMNYASGDDVFLLHRIKKEYGSKAIQFLKDKDAIIETEALESFGALLKQRKRWASKGKGYKDIFTLFLAFVVSGFSLGLLATAILFVFYPNLIWIFVGGLGLKIIIDFGLLMSASSFFKQQKIMWLYLPQQIIYPLYTLIIMLFAIFTKNEWKGRKIN